LKAKNSESEYPPKLVIEDSNQAQAPATSTDKMSKLLHMFQK
jgi:hypothetical protein